jgi:hypothetical protein
MITVLLMPTAALRGIRMSCLTVSNFLYQFQYHPNGTVELQFRMDDEGDNTGKGRIYTKTDGNGNGGGRKQKSDYER